MSFNYFVNYKIMFFKGFFILRIYTSLDIETLIEPSFTYHWGWESEGKLGCFLSADWQTNQINQIDQFAS